MTPYYLLVNSIINNKSLQVNTVKNIDEHYKKIEFGNIATENEYIQKMTSISDLYNMQVSPCFLLEKNEDIGLSGYFYVKLKQAADTNILYQLANNIQAKIISKQPFLSLWYTLVITNRTQMNGLDAANYFYESGLFQSAQPDFLYEGPFECSVDPYFSSQWGLNNIGQYTNTPGIDIRALHAWELTMGNQNIKTAVLDGGIDQIHPDLRNNVVISIDPETNSPINYYSDRHAIAIAGIIAAEHNNNSGIKGIAPNTKLMSVYLGLNGGSTPIVERSAKAIKWAYQNGADVINNSWKISMSSVTREEILIEAIDSALTYGRNGKGCILVFAAGNFGATHVYSPANLDQVIAVGAATPCGTRKSYNSCDTETNWSSCYGEKLDIVAPGVLISTTDTRGSAGYNIDDQPVHIQEGGTLLTSDFDDQDYTIWFAGTSAATPFISGTAALMLSANPDLTQQQVRTILESTCTKLPNYTFSNNPNHPNSTWNIQVGHGLLNSHAAVFKALFYGKEITGSPFIASSHEYSLSDRSYPDSVVFSWTSSSNIRIVCGESGQRIIVHGLSIGAAPGWIRLTVSHKGETKTFSRNIMVIGTQSPQTIMTNTIWQYSSPYILTNTVTIENGAKLTINSSQIQCAPDAKFIVKVGGKLILNACTLTNLSTCKKNLWQGIEVWGNPSLEQNGANQGCLEMLNGSIIQNAVCGIYVGCPSATGSYEGACGGGLIVAANSYFYNNFKSVEFRPYEAPSSSSYTPPNKSNFTNCNFMTFSAPWDDIDSAYFTVTASNAMVRLYGVRGIRFSGCGFANFKGGYDVSDCGIGIYGNNASVTIEGTGFSMSNPFIPSQYSSFSGFGRAIVLKDAGTRTSSINFADFLGNYVGIYASLVDKLSIKSSIIRPITERNPPLSHAHGIYLEYCDGYTIENNQFIGDGNNGTGLRIDNSGEGNNYVQINTFSNLCLATLASGINGTATISNYTGLLYKCNKFSNNNEDIRVDDAPESRIKFLQIYNNNIATGNIFENSTVAIRNTAAPEFIFYYYYNSTQTNHHPTGYVSIPPGYIYVIGRNSHSCKGIGYMGKNYYMIAEQLSLDILENNYFEIANTLEKIENVYIEKYGDKEINWKELLESGKDLSDFPQAKLCMEIAGLADKIQETCNDAFAILNETESFDRETYNKWLLREGKLRSQYLLAESYMEMNDWEKVNEILKEIPEKFPAYNKDEYNNYLTYFQYRNKLQNNYVSPISEDEMTDLMNDSPTSKGSPNPAFVALLERITGAIVCLNLDNKCDVVFTRGGEGTQKSMEDNPVMQDGINNDLISVNIYPNPANNTVYISLDKMPENSVHYQFYDIQGKELQSGNFSNQKQELDISAISKGIYFISVTVENQLRITKKVVKE
jgi:subtilisin family serine protease